MTDWPDSEEQNGEGASSLVEAVDEELWSRLAFHVCGHGVVHDPGRVGELVRDPDVQPVPNAPQALTGLLNRQGRVVPIYDIRHMLPATGDGRRRSAAIEWIIVFYDQTPGGTEETDHCTGIVVDDVPLQLRLKLACDDTPTESVPELFRAWCRHVYEHEGVLYPEVDVIGMIESIRDGGAQDVHGDAGGRRVD